MIASPPDDLNMPVMILIRVVLPAPLWPKIPKTSFCLIENFNPLIALRTPNSFYKL
jgi:hypothetical protein